MAGLRVLDVAYLAAEIAVYVAVAVAAGQHQWLLGVAAVVAMACWWGLLHSPKAPARLPRSLDLALRAAWFTAGLACAVVALR